MTNDCDSVSRDSCERLPIDERCKILPAKSSIKLGTNLSVPGTSTGTIGAHVGSWGVGSWWGGGRTASVRSATLPHHIQGQVDVSTNVSGVCRLSAPCSLLAYKLSSHMLLNLVFSSNFFGKGKFNRKMQEERRWARIRLDGEDKCRQSTRLKKLQVPCLHHIHDSGAVANNDFVWYKGWGVCGHSWRLATVARSCQRITYQRIPLILVHTPRFLFSYRGIILYHTMFSRQKLSSVTLFCAIWWSLQGRQ